MTSTLVSPEHLSDVTKSRLHHVSSGEGLGELIAQRASGTLSIALLVILREREASQWLNKGHVQHLHCSALLLCSALLCSVLLLDCSVLL